MQSIVKYLGQLRVFDKMKREKTRSEQALQLDV